MSVLIKKSITRGEVKENCCYTVLVNSKLKNLVLAAIDQHTFTDK